ncbi:MAG: hypothetical protein PHX21_01795 [bacterium]|nr:hypothetical protein [bacterium]
MLKLYRSMWIMAGIILCGLITKLHSSESSSWGTVAVWPDFDAVKYLDLSQKCAIYNQELDTAQVCGLGWDRPNSLPGMEEINLDGIQYELHIEVIR